MNIAFRVDASLEIGTGHVMRCLTLAGQLTEDGCSCVFVCREHKGNLGEEIAARGYKILWLTGLPGKRRVDSDWNAHAAWLGESWEADAEQTIRALAGYNVDWLIVDHYALDSCWERRLANTVKRIMVIDDLADRPHSCNLLLDQTHGKSRNDYKELVNKECEVLCGSMYALLRPEFAELRAVSIERRSAPQLKNILVSMGGVDKDNYTGKVIDLLAKCDLPNNCKITIILGRNAPWRDTIVRRAQDMNISVKFAVDNMAELMTESDFAIGALGSTAWERCCLGLPSAMFILAENQKVASHIFSTTGAALIVSEPKDEQRLINLLTRATYDAGILIEMSSKSSAFIDGEGVNRVCSILLKNNYGM